MLPFGGAVTFSTPSPAVKFRPTSRCSMSIECVCAPGRTSTTEAMLDAAEVWTWNVCPYPNAPGVTPVIVGRVAGVPSELNRYAGE